VTDNQMKDRVKLLPRHPSADGETPDHPRVVDPALSTDQALRVLALAQRTAEVITREAQDKADETRRRADEALAAAHEQAEAIVGDGRQHAEQLKIQAQQRYEDAVGGLSVKRTALQQQIEALELFDSDYRRRLTTFMQGQLRALWADRPEVGADPDIPAVPPTGPAAGSDAA
jgi:cell division septum initiation protein DivIVA